MKRRIVEDAFVEGHKGKTEISRSRTAPWLILERESHLSQKVLITVLMMINRKHLCDCFYLFRVLIVLTNYGEDHTYKIGQRRKEEVGRILDDQRNCGWFCSESNFITQTR